MIPFNPNEGAITGAIKNQVEKFIKGLTYQSIITHDQEVKILADLGQQWNDDRFSPKVLLPAAMEYAVYEWKQENLNQVQLWKDVCVQNAGVSNTPHMVADEAVNHFNKTFKP